MMIIWLYASISVLIISLAGLAMIIFLPSIQNNHQSNISQIFVGLAVGTLCSDALLHLLPHAFSSKIDHHFENETNTTNEFQSKIHNHSDSIWFGLLALVGITSFLIFERLATILIDLFNQPDEKIEEKNKCSTSAEYLALELEKLNHNKSNEMKDLTDAIKNKNADLQLLDECHRSTLSYPKPNGDGFIHITSHHHHHHKANRGPSAAMMVLLGDLVHNLFDGLAIGVAYSGSGIAGGISTSIAVLCHELPHELGDFTIVIRSGMSLKQAIYWNMFASIICLMGMCLGIFLGSIQDAWLSALIGGTFLYISLVDMVPELDSCPHLPWKRQAIKLTVQFVGMMVGIAIMLIISLYESKFYLFLNASLINRCFNVSE